MSRLDDLIDLIQSANEIYLINPTRNVRSAFIQIDDLCELAMKSWLQIDTQSRQKSCTKKLEKLNILINNRHKKSIEKFFARDQNQSELEQALGITSQNLQHKRNKLDSELINYGHLYGFLEDWITQEGNGQYKSFNTVIEEVKNRKPNHTYLHKLLTRINARRDNRNNFFHNHEQSGLTVNQEKCLQAFLDLYKMMKCLFGRNFTQAIQANSVVKAQIMLMKLRARSYKTSIVNNHFYQIANTRGNIEIMPNSFGYDLCFLNEDAETFIVKIQGYFEVEIAKVQDKIDRISNLQKQNKNHIRDLNKYNSEIDLLKSIIDECLS